MHRKNPSIAWVCAGALTLCACGADTTTMAGTGNTRGTAGSTAQPQAAGSSPFVVSTAGTPSTSSVGVAAAGSGSAGTGTATTLPPGAAGAVAMAGRPGGVPALPRAGSGSRPPTGMSAAGAAAPPPMVMNPADCPPAPADATPQAAAALAAVNTVRIASGTTCVNLVNTISNGATAHCNYYTMYMANDMCIANPHAEVMGCMGFTGASPGARSKAAGYTMGGGGEVLAFLNNPQKAVDTWVNSVWHRTPILDPSTLDIGYGFAAGGCDIIDFGRGTAAPANALVVYPYDGETNVVPSFNGALEGPMPPAPSTGWPSGLPVSVHGKALMITEHVLTVDGDATPIDHVFLDGNSTDVDASLKGTLKTVNFLYANKPLMPNTKYHVKVSGTYGGGMLMKEWSFTTGAARRF